MIGQTIGHYTIIEKLGEGGMGVVYKAEDTKLRRLVAIKFLSPESLGNEEEKARFIHEAQAAAALDHSNICTIYEINEIEDKSFITMAYVDGPSLKDELESGPLEIDRAVELSLQIAEGLKAAHEKGIVHRDIKTGNVLLTSKGQVKIADFGLAKLPGRTRLTKTGSTVGTIAYMSPEQARGEEVGQRSDIWSLGVILYEMLSGKRPFEGYHEQAVAYSILNEEPVPVSRHRPDVPSELEAVISKALQKKVEKRYSSAADIIADLKKIQAGRGIGVPAASSNANVVLKWSVPVVLALLVAFMSFQLVKHRGPPERSGRIKLAVVDFDVLSGEDADYLAGGLADGICVKLSKIGRVALVSGEDVRRLRKEELSATEVAKKLGAEFALGGTLLESGGRIRVTPQLIKASTGEVVWSALFDRTFNDVFGFLDEVSLKIADALKIELDPGDRNAVLKNPTESAEAYGHYLKGRHHYYSETPKDNEKAEVEFQRALQIDPKYPLAMAGLADTYLQRYREEYDYDEYWLDEAERLIKRALRLDPELAEAYKSLAGILMIKEDFPKAIEAAEKALEIRRDWDDPYVLLGDIYKERGELRRSLDMYEHAIAIRSSVGALCGKGEIYVAFGEMDSARTAYRTAMKVNPHNERPYIELGEMYEKQRQPKKAEELFRKAIEVRPDRSWAYRDLMDFISSDRYDEMEKLLRQYVDKYPYKWGGYDVLSDFLAWYKGDYEAAIEIVEEAVARNPDSVWPHLFMAGTYAWRMRRTAEPEKAVQALKEALKLRPNSAKVLLWVSSIYCSLDSVELWLRYSKQALEKSPSSFDLIFDLIAQYGSHGRYEEAVEVAKLGIEQLPARYEIYSLMGNAMANVDRFPEYMDILEKAVHEYSENPDLWYILTVMQCISGRYDDAVESARRAQNGTTRNHFQLGIALWLSGKSEEALRIFQEKPLEFYRSLWAIAVWKYQKRFKKIESFLDELKRGAIPGSSYDTWAWAAAVYYESMRHFDQAIAVLEEARRSSKATWAYDLNLFLADCYRMKGDLSKAESLLNEIEASLPLEYQAAVEWHYADIAALRGRQEKALEHAQKALGVARGPFSQGHGQVKLAKLLYAAGQEGEASRVLTPIKGYIFRYLFRPYYRKGQLETASGKAGTTKYLRRALLAATFVSRGGATNLAGINLAVARSFCAMAAARLGDSERARSEIEYALRLEPEMAEVAYNAACTYSLLGDTDAGLNWLSTVVQRGWQELWWARVDPDLDSLRRLSRFKKIMSDWDRRLQSVTG